MKRLRLSVVLAILFCVVLSAKGYALSSTVAPAFVRLSVSSQQQQDTTSVALTNNDKTAISYSMSIVDVDVATGSLLPKNTVSELTKQLVTVTPITMTLAAGDSINIQITAQNFEKLPPGGHYAALKIEPQIASVKRTNSNIQQAISVPIFVIKQDGALQTLSASFKNTRKLNIGTLPRMQFTVKNTGNVDVVPYGFVSAIAGTATLSKQVINNSSAPLFAGQERTFEIAQPTATPHFLKKVAIVASYRAGEGQKQEIITENVWFVPLWLVFAVVLAPVCLFFAMKKYRLYSKSKKVTQQIKPKKARTTRAKRLEQQQQTSAPQKKKTVVSDFGSTKGIK